MAVLMAAVALLFGAFPLQALGTQKVHFAVYYESLCPDCKQFFMYQIFPTFSKIGEIMDVTLVPYGNAQEHKYGDKWVFYCQHGSAECTGNMIQACAISITQDPKVYIPFVHCHLYYGPSEVNAKYCTSLHNIDYSHIQTCFRSSQGNALMHAMALQTTALNPPHQYVPWVTLNGKHTSEIQARAQTNLLQLVCDTYPGPKPNGCFH